MPPAGAGCISRSVISARAFLVLVVGTASAVLLLVSPAAAVAPVYSCNGLITAKVLSSMTGRSVVAQPSGKPSTYVTCDFRTDARLGATSWDITISAGDFHTPIATVKANAVAPSADFATGVPKWHFGVVPGLGKDAMVGGFSPDVYIVAIVGPKNVLFVHYTAMTYKHVKALPQTQVLAIARAVYAKLV